MDWQHQIVPDGEQWSVGKVSDGDTIDVLTDDQETVGVRLNGIDAPEEGRPFGKDARDLLNESIGRQTVQIVPHDRDQYGRTIGDIFQGGTLISVTLLRADVAWHNVQLAPDNMALADAERKAGKANAGLWSSAQGAIPRWEWRAMRTRSPVNFVNSDSGLASLGGLNFNDVGSYIIFMKPVVGCADSRTATSRGPPFRACFSDCSHVPTTGPYFSQGTSIGDWLHAAG